MTTVTGQLADTPTRGLDDSRTGHLVDWSTRGLDNSRTGQVADATGDFACLVFVLLAASVRPRVVQSASWQSASWRIRELSSNHMVGVGQQQRDSPCTRGVVENHPVVEMSHVHDHQSSSCRIFVRVWKRFCSQRHFSTSSRSDELPTHFMTPVYPTTRLLGPAVEHWSLADVLSLSCARPVADG